MIEIHELKLEIDVYSLMQYKKHSIYNLKLYFLSSLSISMLYLDMMWRTVKQTHGYSNYNSRIKLNKEYLGNRWLEEATI